ncbi:MAG: type II secretion system F family protein [Candidatus Woesebacteria bacterium]|nr:MAG: type II secretion system F family protein [Candidatus Woesebacteria bacterium]
MKLPGLSEVRFVDKLLFAKHLSVMLKSGITIYDSVNILYEQSRNKAFKKILLGILNDLKNGLKLSKSLEKYPDVFDKLFVSIIAIGEESGNLDANLEYLASQLSKNYEFRKKVRAALIYPTIIVIAAIIVGGGISIFVLPKLTDLFESLDVALPLSTKILLFFANTMKNYGIFIVAFLVGGFIIFWVAIDIPKIKLRWQRFVLRIPFFGNFIMSVEITNFCRNLGVMLKSGIPISEAMVATTAATSNLVFKGYISLISKAVDKGVSIEKEITRRNFKHMPAVMTRMIGVGEKSGKLSESLLYLSNFFEEEVDDMAQNLPSVIEPVLLIIIALFVSFLALSIISPIYQFTGSIRQ